MTGGKGALASCCIWPAPLFTVGAIGAAYAEYEPHLRAGSPAALALARLAPVLLGGYRAMTWRDLADLLQEARRLAIAEHERWPIAALDTWPCACDAVQRSPSPRRIGQKKAKGGEGRVSRARIAPPLCRRRFSNTRGWHGECRDGMDLRQVTGLVLQLAEWGARLALGAAFGDDAHSRRANKAVDCLDDILSAAPREPARPDQTFWRSIERLAEIVPSLGLITPAMCRPALRSVGGRDA